MCLSSPQIADLGPTALGAGDMGQVCRAGGDSHRRSYRFRIFDTKSLTTDLAMNPQHVKANHWVSQGIFNGLISFTEFEARVNDLLEEKDRGDAFEIFVEGYLATQAITQHTKHWVVGRFAFLVRLIGVSMLNAFWIFPAVWNLAQRKPAKLGKSAVPPHASDKQPRSRRISIRATIHLHTG